MCGKISLKRITLKVVSTTILHVSISLFLTNYNKSAYPPSHLKVSRGCVTTDLGLYFSTHRSEVGDDGLTLPLSFLGSSAFLALFRDPSV